MSPVLHNSSRDLHDTAQRLLGANQSHPEDRIRQYIVRLLDKLDIENDLTYRTPAGPADIFLPRRRIFIETKAVGLADYPHHAQARGNPETPFEQLKRYLTAEMHEELKRLPLDGLSELPWTGIVTDGRVWHVWQFTNDTDHTTVFENFRPQTGEELILRIAPLLNVEPVGKPWIPANPVPLFEKELEKLREIHAGLARRVQRTTNTKMQLWLDMLQGSGMGPENHDASARLFTTHCFLVALARGVVHTLLNPNIRPNPCELLGSGFLAWIIEVENGRRWAQELLDHVHNYEWRRTAGDVLRPLYESFVDAKDRRDFGEVYTPDWLSEMMVSEVLDEAWCNNAVTHALIALRKNNRMDGIGVLDPTCGSGTFLFHCAKRILASESAQGLQPVQQADVVCHLVHGIDIHPVAIEFSRATLLRALPASPSTSNMALAIYQGDALMLRQTDNNSLFKPSDGEILIRTPSGSEIVLPRTFTEHADFSDMLRRMVDAAANNEPLPADIGCAAENENDRNMVDACHKSLTEVIKKEGNSVWTWYITNILGPDRLASRKVNRIVANPPWVKLANIQNSERKRALESMAGKDNVKKHLNLWTGGNQAPHFDIAQLFICHARKTYLNEPKADPSAWVTKAAAIRAGNWKKFRDWHSGFLAQALDLSCVKAFGGGDARRSCVLFEIRPSALASTDDDKQVLEVKCSGETPEVSSSWEKAKALLSWNAPRQFPQEPSDYAADSWRQGATIVPKVLTTTERMVPGTLSNTRTVTTIKSNKPPWNKVAPREGEVPAHWLAPLLTSRQLLPFGLATSKLKAIIPRNEDGGLLSTETARQTAFWANLDDLYREHRGQGSNTPQTLLDQIDYAGKLSSQLQLLSHRSQGHMVIYPSSGDVMRAACISKDMVVMDSKIYRRIMGSIEEAHYLTAVLNAPILEKAFRACRTSGRDFHKNPWRAVPVPAWNAGNRTHQQLAELASQAEESVRNMTLPDNQIAASRRIREQLAQNGLFAKINTLAGKILPDHSQEP